MKWTTVAAITGWRSTRRAVTGRWVSEYVCVRVSERVGGRVLGWMSRLADAAAGSWVGRVRWGVSVGVFGVIE